MSKSEKFKDSMELDLAKLKFTVPNAVKDGVLDYMTVNPYSRNQAQMDMIVDSDAS
jgi:hypothetical protein